MEHVAALKVVLGNSFVMYFKAHSYHWNVEGKNFSEYHKFLGELYEEIHDAIDAIAEQIRAANEYAPFSLNDLYRMKTIEEDVMRLETPEQMFGSLLAANNEVIESLNKLFTAADAANEQGLADFAAGRIDTHKKHGWMLRSFMKGE
jgi:starvation-inducible DNA-binding protein